MNQENRQLILKSTVKRQKLLGDLVAPARAAANQMKDAGMKLGSDPLFEILFQLDALDQEMMELLKKDPETLIEMILEGRI
jgi:hypothetical protein